MVSPCLLVQGDPLINLRSKEQEAELVRQTLAALTAMRIRFPGKTEEEAEAVLDEVGALTELFYSCFLCVPRCVSYDPVIQIRGQK